ncbi:hypothetical protein, partial [Undibacterium squillarum]|uniref:hypothetical protein n=1 Tax=Undibacterium squillarum TaxID=1131567 RepID=UPI0035AFF9F4
TASRHLAFALVVIDEMSSGNRRTQVTIHINQTAHLPDFIRLNQRWIQQYFQLEAADHALAADPEKSSATAATSSVWSTKEKSPVSAPYSATRRNACNWPAWQLIPHFRVRALAGN